MHVKRRFFVSCGFCFLLKKLTNSYFIVHWNRNRIPFAIPIAIPIPNEFRSNLNRIGMFKGFRYSEFDGMENGECRPI